MTTNDHDDLDLEDPDLDQDDHDGLEPDAHDADHDAEPDHDTGDDLDPDQAQGFYNPWGHDPDPIEETAAGMSDEAWAAAVQKTKARLEREAAAAQALLDQPPEAPETAQRGETIQFYAATADIRGLAQELLDGLTGGRGWYKRLFYRALKKTSSLAQAIELVYHVLRDYPPGFFESKYLTRPLRVAEIFRLQRQLSEGVWDTTTTD